MDKYIGWMEKLQVIVVRVFIVFPKVSAHILIDTLWPFLYPSGHILLMQCKQFHFIEIATHRETKMFWKSR